MTTPDPRSAIIKAARKLSANVDGGLHARAASIVDRMLPSVVREAAIDHLVNEARGMWRTKNLSLERKAERDFVAVSRAIRRADDEAWLATLYLGKFVHGDTDSRTGAVPAGCPCSECSAVRHQEAEWEDRRTKARTALMDEYRATLRIEWTSELLASGMAMPDGSITTWGEATVAQHEARLEMLATNVHANASTAARHQYAIDAIRATRALSLAEAAAILTRKVGTP